MGVDAGAEVVEVGAGELPVTGRSPARYRNHRWLRFAGSGSASRPQDVAVIVVTWRPPFSQMGRRRPASSFWKADRFIDFCKRLLLDADGPVFLLIDGHPTHPGQEVTRFAEPPSPAPNCSLCPATRPTANPTSGCGSTSRPTASAAPASPPSRTSSARPCRPSSACRNCPTSSGGSSAIPTWPTSPPDPRALSTYF